MNFQKKSAIAFTMDVDWAPDSVLDYELNILAKYGIDATIFMTHKTDVDTHSNEIAIHPNFTSLNFEKHIEERLNEYPGAKGCRSHSLMYTERIRTLYHQYGIEYDSNFMLYKEPVMKPFLISRKVFELPLYWMDNFYIEMEGENPSFSLNDFDLKSPGLKVFNFHPIHVFLNTSSMHQYNMAKKHYQDPENFKKFRDSKFKGTKDFMIELLDYVKSEKLKVVTLGEVNNHYRKIMISDIS